MTNNVVSLHAEKGSHLATLSLWRMPDGSIHAVVEDMPKHVIEGARTISDRFVSLSEWTLEGICDLLKQASQFDLKPADAQPPEAS